MPVNHSRCPGNHTIHTQSKFLSPPVPLTSPCHYIFFEIPLMKNESFSCQHRLEPVACHSFAVVFWSKAPPSGFPRPYFHTTQERMLQSKLVDEVILCGSRKVAGNQTTNWLFPWDIQQREWKQNRAQLRGGGETSPPGGLAYKILDSDTKCHRLLSKWLQTC